MGKCVIHIILLASLLVAGTLHSCKINDLSIDPDEEPLEDHDEKSLPKEQPYDGRLVNRVTINNLNIYGFDAVYDGEKWVVAGNEIFISKDAIHWEKVNTGLSAGYRNIAWNGKIFVAVGLDRIITSNDAQTWVSRNVPEYRFSRDTTTPSDIIWTGKEFVVTTGDFRVYKSTDGLEWRSFYANPMRQLTWGNGVLVSTSTGINYFTYASKDGGETWTRSTSAAGGAITNIVYARGQFYGFGVGYVYTSNDGMNWAKIGDRIDHGNNIIFFNDRFYSSGYPNPEAPGLGIIKESIDGLTWTIQKSGYHFEPKKLTAHQKGGMLALGEEILWSADGETWKYRVPRTLNHTHKVRWAIDRAVIAGSKEGLLITKDLQHFELIGYSYRGEGFSAATWTGNKYIAVGEKGRILSSDDGKSFVSYNAPVSDNLIDVVSSPKGIVAVGANATVVFSQDGTNWQKQNISDKNAFFTTVEFINNRFLALSSLGIFSSTNGKDWIHVYENPTPTTDAPTNIAYNGSVYVAATGNQRGQIYVSKNATDWTEILLSSISPYKLSSLQYTGKEFVAFATKSGDAELIASNDGISWSTIYSFPSGTRLLDMEWTGTDFIFVGDYSSSCMIGKIN